MPSRFSFMQLYLFLLVHKHQTTPVGQGTPVAVKVLKEGSDDARKALLDEAAVMGQFRHRNVVKLIGVVLVDDPVSVASTCFRCFSSYCLIFCARKWTIFNSTAERSESVENFLLPTTRWSTGRPELCRCAAPGSGHVSVVRRAADQQVHNLPFPKSLSHCGYFFQSNWALRCSVCQPLPSPILGSLINNFVHILLLCLSAQFGKRMYVNTHCAVFGLQVLVVLEFMSGGDLFSHLLKMANGRQVASLDCSHTSLMSLWYSSRSLMSHRHLL